VDSASSYSGIFNDASGAHNLSLTGNIGVSGSKSLTNNMVSGAALYLGGGPGGVTGANPASIITIASGGNLTLLQQPGGSPLLSYAITAGNGTTVINDQITGAGGLTVQNGASVTLTNTTNNYTGATLVNSSAAGTLGGTLLVNGNITANSSMIANGAGTGATAVGTGGTLGGTGTITGGITTIGSTTGGTQGGVIDPGTGGTSPGTLTAASGAMTWDPFGRYVFDYNGGNNAVGGGINSEILGSGSSALSLGNLASGTPFDLDLQEVVAGSSTGPYVLADFAGGITGASGDVTSLFTFSGNSTSGTPDVMVMSDGSGGQELALTFAGTPEPASLSLLLLGGGLALSRRRRKQ
jgi:hypothetical protein